MIASISCRSCRTTRTTLSGLPPTPTQTVIGWPEGRENRLVFQRAAGLAGPGDGGGADKLGEEIKAFLEQLFVVVQVMPEERVTFGKGPAPEDRLGPAVRQGVQGGKALEDADGVIGGQDRDGGAKLDPLGPPGDGGQHDLGCRDGEIGAVMFAQADEINADFVGEGGLVQHLAQDDVHGLRLCRSGRARHRRRCRGRGKWGSWRSPFGAR